MSITAMKPEPASDTGTGPVPGLDPQALARLRELDPDGRHGVVPRVLAAFETSLQRMLAQLSTQHGAAHSRVVAGIAHTLKSSSASVGALDLARTCAEVEARLRSADESTLGVDTARLVAEGEAALQAVRAILGR